jgi:alpha-tubulin suppressor-like RCC1 family protein
MAALLDLPIELLACVCQHLNLRELVCVSETCNRLRHGDGGMKTAELPTKSPAVTALREHVFSGGVGIPSTLPVGCSDSWVAYLARCARQRRCREAQPIAVGYDHSLFVDVAAWLLACGKGAAVGHADENVAFSAPTPVAAMGGVRMQSISAGEDHSLAHTCDGRIYSWGENNNGQLGHGDELDRPSPVLVEGLEGVCGIAAGYSHSLAVTHLGVVFSWGWIGEPPRPSVVQGFEGVRVHRMCAGADTAFAIGEDGEFFSW